MYFKKALTCIVLNTHKMDLNALVRLFRLKLI